jgi:hypothetical protein
MILSSATWGNNFCRQLHLRALQGVRKFDAEESVLAQRRASNKYLTNVYKGNIHNF